MTCTWFMFSQSFLQQTHSIIKAAKEKYLNFLMLQELSEFKPFHNLAPHFMLINCSLLINSVYLVKHTAIFLKLCTLFFFFLPLSFLFPIFYMLVII